MDKYEYKYILQSAGYIKNNNVYYIDDVLNKYAAQGYRVISINYNQTTNKYACILERKVKSIN